MAKSKKIPVSLKVDLGAKATASAKLSAKVPTRSMGRLVDALTDIIRPFTEKQGLKADLVRLQRGEVAIELAKKAKAIAEIKKQPIKPIPLKSLIPLLEYGSREDPDDKFMIDKWANLLASASEAGSVAPRFVSLLNELDGRQAAVLASIPRDDGPLTEDLADAIKYNLGPILEKVEGTFEDFSDAVLKHFQDSGQVKFNSISAEYEESERLVIRRKQEVWFSVQDNLLDIEILESLGLVRTGRIANWHMLPDANTTIVEYVGVTALGDALLRLTNTPYIRGPKGHTT